MPLIRTRRAINEVCRTLELNIPISQYSNISKYQHANTPISLGCTGLVIGSIFYIPWAVRIFTKCFIGALVVFWDTLASNQHSYTLQFNVFNSFKVTNILFRCTFTDWMAQKLEHSSDVPLECYSKI